MDIKDAKAAPLKFCRFSVDNKVYNGLLRGSMIDIVEGDPFDPSKLTVLRMSYPLDRVKLLCPIVPNKIWCVGRNYVGHVKELNNELPKEPLIFMKALTTITYPGDVVRMPGWVGRIDYEGELAVVIGKRCRKVNEEDALSYVAGYSCFNDVTARDLQKKDGQWTRAKSFDTFGPFGPVLLLTQKMPPEAGITTRHNGNVVQQDTFGSMIFPVERIISHISRFATLEPGDVIATGTPEGVGKVAPGDRVEVEIEGIGAISNPFIAEM